MRFLSVACTTAVLACLASTAGAMPIRWTVEGTVNLTGFSPAFSGYFVWDADTRSMSAWDIEGYGAFSPFVGPGCLLQIGDFCVHGNFDGLYGNTLTFSSVVDDILETSEILVMTTVAPLTDRGGSVPLVAGEGVHPASYFKVYGNSPPDPISGVVFAPVPEPAPAGLIGVAVGGALAGLFVRSMAWRTRSGHERRSRPQT